MVGVFSLAIWGREKYIWKNIFFDKKIGDKKCLFRVTNYINISIINFEINI